MKICIIRIIVLFCLFKDIYLKSSGGYILRFSFINCIIISIFLCGYKIRNGRTKDFNFSFHFFSFLCADLLLLSCVLYMSFFSLLSLTATITTLINFTLLFQTILIFPPFLLISNASFTIKGH